jgi:hypothetical protein
MTMTEVMVSANLTGLQGTWSVSFPGGGTRTTSGVVSGLKAGSDDRFAINLDPFGLPPCLSSPPPYGLHGNGFVLNVAIATTRLAGSSTYYTCSEAFEGTVDVSR